MTQLEALKIIAKRDGDVITPAAVIHEAKNPKSVLHGAFTWNNTKAAEKWRIHEAQQLIRRFHVEVVGSDGERVRTPCFVNLSCDRNSDAANNPYRMVESVANDGDLMEVAVKDALDELKAVESRHGHLKRLRKVWDAIDAEK